MTEAATETGRVGYRLAGWDKAVVEIKNSERFPPDTSYALLERTEHIEFVKVSDALSGNLFDQYWASGHIFNETWELQFERQDNHNTCQLRLLTERDIPNGWQVAEFEVGRGGEMSILLFGERKRDTDPGWREARIPRWLEYPVPQTPGRARLIVIPYLRDGVVVRMRLKGVSST